MLNRNVHRNLKILTMTACIVFASSVASHPSLAAYLTAPETPPKSEEKDEPKSDDKEKEKVTPMPALAFEMKDIDGKMQDLRQYHGNVVLMVNVASECGLTPHYEGLQKLYEQYKDRGFVILGFPANNFGKQEPGTNEEIKSFCKKNYGVSFPIFAKVSVKGDDQCPLYKYLTDKKADHKHGGSIKWNFSKILVDRNGHVVDRFAPPTKPDAKKLVTAVEKQLEVEIPKDSALDKQRKEEKEEKPKPKSD